MNGLDGQNGGGAGQGQPSSSVQQQAQPQAQQLLAQMQRMAAAQQQQQQQQQQQLNNGVPNGMMAPQSQSHPQPPQQLQQNPVQMLQVITAQIANLQRQWQTVQAQPDGQQKMEAAQQLATQMKRMKMFQAQTVQALQRQQQQQQQQQGQQTGQQGQQQGELQSQDDGPGQTGQPQNGGTGQQGQPQGQQNAGEAAGPAHNAQLAALQAFAQQQRMQAMQHRPSQQSSQQQQQPQDQQKQPQQQQGQGGTPQQKGDLLGAVRAFMAHRGTPFPPNMPTAFVGPAAGSAAGETKTIDMQTLFATVIQFGGSARIAAQPNGWAIVASKMGLAVAPIPPNHQPGQNETDANGNILPSFVASRLAQFFQERFAAFEEFWLTKMKGGGAQQQQGKQGQQQGQQLSSLSGNAPAMEGSTNGMQNTGQQATNPQDAARRAQEMQAQLPQQLQQLQEMMRVGKLSQQQAKERYMYLQNAAKMAMLHAQALAQAQAQAQTQSATATGPGTENGDHGRPGPSALPQQGHQQTMPPAQPAPATTPLAAPTPTPAAPGPQAGSNETKKPAKRARKSTNSSAAAAKGVNSNESKGSGAAIKTNDSLAGGAPPVAQQQQKGGSSAQVGMQAQQAIRLLHQGALNPAQQVSLFAAIQTAQLQMQGVHGVDVTNAAQALASVYNHVLIQAQDSGQPLNVAASTAFAAAQQGTNKQQQVPPSQSVPSVPGPPSGQVHQGPAGPGPSPALQSAAVSPGRQAGPAIPALPGPTTGATSPAPSKPTKPVKFKVEYMPVRRDVRSYGGWDLDLVDAQIGPLLAGRGRLPRSVRELGQVDVEVLIMSLRSRIEVEVTYALNTLLILTASVQAPGFHLLLSLCEDLCDELLDLLEEAAFGRLSEASDGISSPETAFIGPVAMPDHTLSHADWVIGVLEDEDENKIHARSQGGDVRHTRQTKRLLGGLEGEDCLERKSEDCAGDGMKDYYAGLAEDRESLRQAEIALTIIEILCNAAVIPDNHLFLNNEPRFFELLMKIVAATEHEELKRRRGKFDHSTTSNGIDVTVSSCDRPPPTVFTTAEALRLRKDVLSIIASLAGETCVLANLDQTTIFSLFDFLSSFVFDTNEIELQHGTVFREMPIHPPPPPTPQNPHPPPPPLAMQPFMRKVPQHADLALEAFSSIAQPDINRKLLGDTIADDKMVALGTALIKLLPVSDLDFHMLKTEARLGYCERIAMSLFDVSYMGKADVKRRLRQLPGIKGIVFRCIKRLMKVHSDFSHNPFSVLTRRLVETLRVLSDGENMFNRPALLGFGMETNVSTKSTARGSSSRGISANGDMSSSLPHGEDGNLLIEDEVAVVDLMTLEGIDPTIISELEKML